MMAEAQSGNIRFRTAELYDKRVYKECNGRSPQGKWNDPLSLGIQNCDGSKKYGKLAYKECNGGFT